MSGIVPILFCGIVLVGVFTYYLAKNRIVANISREIEAMGRQAQRSTAEFFQYNDNDLLNLSDTPLLNDYAANVRYGLTQEAEQYRRELERHFARFAARRPGVTSIRYINSSGRVVCGLEGGSALKIGHEKPVEPLFSAIVAAKTGVFRTIEKPGSADAYIVAGRQLFDSDGKPSGAIIITKDAGPLSAILNTLKPGRNGSAYILGESGGVLLRSEADGDPSDGERLVTRRYGIADTGFALVVVADISEYLGVVSGIRNYSILFALACLLVSVLALHYFVQTILSPIQALAVSTKELAFSGSYTPVPVSGSDEIGELAASFNTMAGTLIQRTSQLEARLRELVSLQLMSGELNKRLEPNTIIKVFLDTAINGLGFDRGALYVLDESGRSLERRYSCNLKESGVGGDASETGRRITLASADILSGVAEYKKALNVTDTNALPEKERQLAELFGPGKFCLAPLVVRGRIFGLITADNNYSGKPITAEQMASLPLFVESAGMALENSELISSLRQSENRYRVILDSADDAIIGLDISYNVIIWNRGAEKIFGVPFEQVKGNPLDRFINISDYLRILENIATKGSFEGYNLTGATADGKELRLDIRWVQAAGGAKKEWAVVMRNVTDFNRLQGQLIQAEKMSALGLLISNITHDLNNPMTVIQGYAELLRDRAAASGVPAPEIEAIYKNAQRCGAIVENFLSFTRATPNQKKPVDLRLVAEAVLQLSQAHLKVGQISVTKDFAQTLPAVVCNFQQMEQVLVNLVRNALDSLLQLTENRELVISISADSGKVRLEVSDNGPGISAERLPRIFEPFFTTKEQGSGSGLGLSICKQIVELYGGTISVHSEPFAQTSFVIELPATGDDRALSGESAAPAPLREGARVLVVDDESDVRSLLGNILASHGLRVDSAANGPDALRMAAAVSYDVVLCDIEMTPLDGFAVYERLLSGPVPPRFIFMTGKVLTESLGKKLYDLRVPCLHKPFGIMEVLSLLNSPVPVAPAA